MSNKKELIIEITRDVFFDKGKEKINYSYSGRFEEGSTFSNAKKYLNGILVPLSSEEALLDNLKPALITHYNLSQNIIFDIKVSFINRRGAVWYTSKDSPEDAKRIESILKKDLEGILFN